MLTHCHLPLLQKLLETIIVPIIKDKKGLITNTDNNRPIAVTTVVSKIMELVLLERLHSHLCTSDNQFGFKAGHGTDMCVFTLKQVVEFIRISQVLYMYVI